MRKTNKNLTKQILTLMLAFIMVFTGMGIGSRGVDTAWADETSTNQQISIEDTIEKTSIGSYNGYNVWEVVLAEEINSFTLTSTSGMNATTADDGTGGQRENKAIEKNDSNFAAAKSYFETVKASISGYTFNDNDHLLFRVSQFDITTFTVVVKGYIAVTWNVAETIRTDISIDEMLGKEAVGTYNGGKVYKVLLPKNVEAFTLTSTSGMNATTADDGTGGQRENKAIEKNDSNFAAAKSYFETAKTSIPELTFSSNDYLLFRISQFDITTFTVIIKGYILVEWERGTDSTNIDELRNLINTISAMDEDEYYNKDDRYNGKDNSSTGFWKDMQSALTTAKGLFTDETLTSLKTGVPQSQVNKAKEDLASAIANLIPKTQLNATKLYEAVQAHGNYSEEFLENCTDVSAAAYREIAEKVKAYLNSLFDKKSVSADNPNGATEENIAANQTKADGYAEELKNFTFLFKEEVTNATWNLKTINALAKQYDMTENNGKYTEESWNTFVAARKAATEYAQQHPISNSMKSAEVKEYAKLARAFQSAAYGLTSKKETVTVTFSYTDDYHLRWVDIKEPLKSWTSDPKTSKVQKQTLELISGTTLEELWNQTGCTPGTSYFAPNSYSTWRTLVNGRMLNGYTPGVQQYFADANYVLKDGDEIQLVHMDWPTFVFNYIYRDDVKWDKMADILGILRFAESEEGSQNAAAGEDIKLTRRAYFRTSLELYRHLQRI